MSTAVNQGHLPNVLWPDRLFLMQQNMQDKQEIIHSHTPSTRRPPTRLRSRLQPQLRTDRLSVRHTPIMGLPKAPIKSLEQTMEWMSTAPEDIRDPKFLWKECWERFNTIQMPITSTKEYFDIAIKIAKVSHDRSSFEKLFRQTIRQRQAEVTKWYADFKRNAWREGQSFPCGTARILAVEFCRTGSLNYLLQILDGVAYGWKNEEYIVNGGPNEPLSDDGSDDGSEIPLTQFWEEGEKLWYDGMTPPDISNLHHVRDRDVSEAPTIESFNSWHRKPPSSSISAEEHLRQLSQQNMDAKCEHHTENEKSPKKRMRFDDAARVDDAAQPNDESDDYTMFPSHQPTASTQCASEYPPKKRRRLDNTTETERCSMASDRASSGRRTEKRTRANDDCNDGRGLKRQSLKRRTSTTSNATTSVNFSDDTPMDKEKESLNIVSEQAVVDDMRRKRPKTEADDNDNENHRPKRQRIQTPESAPMLHISPPIQQTTDEIMTMTKTKVDDKIKGSQRKSGRRTSFPRAGVLPLTRTLNTRSIRRAGPSTLWELDDTSHPRKIR